MFRSNPKPPARLPSWGVQVLTRDYLIEGQLRPKSSAYVEDFVPNLLRLLKSNAHQDLSDWAIFEGHMRPASNLAAPPQAFARWTLLFGREMLALAPLDAGGQTALRDAYARFKFPFAVTLLVGSYRARGNLLLDGDDGLADLTTFVPMAEATIDCLLPGGQLSNWRPPWVLLNGVAVQGDVRDA